MRNIPIKVAKDLLTTDEFNSIQNELENIVINTGGTLDAADGPDNDLNMLGQASATYGSAAKFYEDSTSTINNIVLNRDSSLESPQSYIAGLEVIFKATLPNTGATTINVVELGVKDLEYSDGSPLASGDIKVGEYIKAIYNSGDDRFDIIYINKSLSTNYYCPDYTETDHGVVGNGNTINVAVDAIGSDNGTIYLRHNSGGATTTYTLNTSETIPSNITLEREPGDILDGTGTITIDGPFKSGKDQAFGSNITVIGLKKAYPEWWGENTTPGTTDMTIESQAALNCAGETGHGIIEFLDEKYLITSPLLIWSNTKVVGAGIGATTMLHPSSHCFKNNLHATTGNSNITINGFSFDADATADGAVSCVGIQGLVCTELDIRNTNPTGVTVGIGIASSTTADSSDIFISNCYMDVADYGIVIDSDTSSNAIKRVTISNNIIKTSWGSCASLAKFVREVTISDNLFTILGDDLVEVEVGIGVKVWQGASLAAGPTDISISGNIFSGPTSRTDIVGISVANYGSNVTIIGNTFKECNDSFKNNFAGTDADGIVFSNNVIKDCDYGYRADDSTDIHPIITNNQFRDCVIGIKAGLTQAVIGSNNFYDISEQAIWAPLSEAAIYSNNNFYDIGREAIYIATNGTSNELNLISSNVFFNCCIATNNTYNVIELNDQPNSVIGNIFKNDGANLPIYIIGRDVSSNYCIINSNWMYGARSGYKEVSGANDIYTGNLERGGIG